MKLFTYATSPYARKVRMALDYKGVNYEPVERCYSLDRKEDLRCASVRAEVPTLVLDDGRTLTDSTILCEYINEVYPTPALVPDDAYERARMRTIEDLCDRAFDAVGYGFWIAVLREAAPEASAMKEAAARELAELLRVLEQELGERDFFCGKLSIADLAAICYVPGAASMGVDLKQTPRLQPWVQRMRAVPAVVADLQRLAEAVAHISITAELEGPDGRVHWRDSRLEWPIRHGFIDFVAREFHAGKIMFPPDAA
ncbi:MAG: glutathione S-transferase family protein [Candidatus Binataceae bacterium]